MGFICENCKKEFEIGYGKKNRFCSRSCCASFNAKKADPQKRRLALEKARRFIKHRDVEEGALCSFCNKFCKMQNSLKNHERLCPSNPNRSKSNLEGKHLKHVKIFINYTCKFCGKSFFQKPKDHRTTHEKYCKANPNSIERSYKLSIEGRKKLSEHMKLLGGYENGCKGGRGHSGWYKGYYCMSSWELAWVYFQLSQGKKIKRCKEFFYYEMDGKRKKYFPDFVMDGIYYEIKNYNRPDTIYKVNQFPKDKKLVLILGEENKPFLDFVESREGSKFWEKLYEKHA